MRIIKLYKYLTNEKKEFIMAKQVLRSGTSIGANIAEGYYAQSELDFINKLSIALKEASETLYWLELLHESGYLDEEPFNSIYTDGVELRKLLTASVNTMKKKNKLTTFHFRVRSGQLK